MARDYIPTARNEFNTFQRNLVKAVVDNAATWGISAGDKNELAAASAEYGDLFKAVGDKSNCTKTQRMDYNQCRARYEKQIRKFVNGHLRDNKNIEHSQFTAMGIKVREKKRRSRSQIDTAVDLYAKSMEGCRVKYYCRIQNHDGKASLHPEADAVEIRYAIGTRPANYAECPHSIIIKKAHPVLVLNENLHGQFVYAFARWVNLTKPDHSGPYGNMVMTMLH